jgi:hypothetical protein
MKFTILSVLCLLGTTMASPVTLIHRDLSVFQYNIRRVEIEMNQLDSALNRRPGYDPRSQDDYFHTAVQLANRVNGELRTGAVEIRRGPSINDIEAI